MINLMSLDKAAEDNDCTGDFKGESKRGRPTGDVERKNKLIRLCSNATNRIVSVKKSANQSTNINISDSVIIEAGLIALSNLKDCELIELINSSVQGE